MKVEGKFKAASTSTEGYFGHVSTEHTAVGKEMLGWLKQFQRIEEKNRCLRVRFLDWLSAKLASWSVSVKQVSDNIHSQCVIKVGDKK
jgi:hypothetical protein